MEEQAHTLKAGYAEKIITPPLGLHIPGNYNVRIADGIINHLKVRSVVFENGEKTCAIIMCDTIRIENSAFLQLKELLENECGISPDCLYIHGTHTHTAIAVGSINETDDRECEYYRWQHYQIRDCVKEAINDSSVCSIHCAKGEAKGVGFLRRYRYKNGTTKTNPPYADPELLGPDGEMDNSLQLVRIIREGKKDILIINFGTHPDTLGGCKYYTDWPGLVVDKVKTAFDGGVEAIFLNGCQGNAGTANRMLPKPPGKKSTAKSHRIARVLTGEVLKIYDSVKPCAGTNIEGYSTTLEIGKNPHTPTEVPLAKEVMDLYKIYKNYKEPIFAEYRAKGMSIPKARRILINEKKEGLYNIPIYGIQIGSLAFIGITGEPFTEIGLAIKRASKMDMTIINCCTNGSNGYFPTFEAFQGEGYERSTSRYAWNCAELITNASISLIRKMEENIQ